jgi:photosystem II stability/assembly factor-like uncharacterized protein
MLTKRKRYLIFISAFGFILLMFQLGTASRIELDSKVSMPAQRPVYAAETNELTTLYYPLVFANEPLPLFELTNAWTSNADGQAQDFFFLWDILRYETEGANRTGEDVSVDLTWRLESVWGETEVFSSTVVLPPGHWQHNHIDIVPELDGSYTGFVEIDFNGEIFSKTVAFPVFLKQAFDKCWLPTVNQMQTWWDSSPYSVWNIYLGGIHFPCSTPELNPSWVQSVSQQGWRFILIWVGPQAPCSDFRYRFSSNWQDAYLEGITEAASALDAAEALGFTGEKIIYYDLEAFYGADSACRFASQKFIQGWTDWLQLQGVKAGAYGSPCNSYMIDWASNDPPPDDVWIAHWLLPYQYRQNASTWNTACLSNSYWANHQRIRQYAGDHTENWGGVSMTIDSSVVDNGLVTISSTLNTIPFTLSSPKLVQPSSTAADIWDMNLVSPEVGWVLRENVLLLTKDFGRSWQDVTPLLGEAVLLDVHFIDVDAGWLAALSFSSGEPDGVILYSTRDGGQTWEMQDLPDVMSAVVDVDLEFIDDRTGWAFLKVQTGSSFSVGRLLSTQDGGAAWEERTAPIGGSVVFLDGERGWMVGGAGGDQIYRTGDAGFTWQPQELSDLPEGQIYIGKPVVGAGGEAVLPVTVLGSDRSNLVIYRSRDGGERWQLTQNVPLLQGTEPGAALPFSFVDGRWWAAVSETEQLLTSGRSGEINRIEPAAGLPPGVVMLDYAADQIGWAVVQDNQCTGEKIPLSGSASNTFSCRTDTHLYQTIDGGVQWMEVPLD